MNDYIRAAVERAVEARSDWLEDILAGLLINGVKPGEIQVRDYADGRTTVAVRGVCCYSWFTVFKK